MAYAKFVTKTNKEGKQISYGPYYYKSIRTPEGKVRNIYLGISPPEGSENGKNGNSIKRLREALARLVAS
ncbi:MAG: hypothetical protein NTY20_03615 [Candidatus Aenigmarchaeota archaeon]|nr:hypothetical protein [Candidatus Aenigmarchaeota archaeon]